MDFSEMKPWKMAVLCVFGCTVVCVGGVYAWVKRVPENVALSTKLFKLMLTRRSSVDQHFDQKNVP